MSMTVTPHIPANPAPDFPSAVCRTADPELWHPEGGTPSQLVRDLCAVCPHRVECLEWALANPPQTGIWGGLGPGERKRIERDRRRKAIA